MNRPYWRSVAQSGVLSLAVLIYCLPGFAQQTLGSINGTVVDSSGAAVQGANVTVTNGATNFSSSTTTQATGFFQVFNLPIGTYSVKVTQTGFETTALNGIPVQEARATTVNATLKVGQASESVEVTSSVTPLLNATDATNGYTMDSAQIAQTPPATWKPHPQAAALSDRSGTGSCCRILIRMPAFGNQPICNGSATRSNTFQVNGVDSTNLFNGKSSSGASSQRYNFNIGSAPTVGGSFSVGTSVYGSNGNSLPSPPPEFMQELRVNASMYDAQQGATSGAQIDVNTNTGTNNWHGQLYGSYANNLNECLALLLQSGLSADPGRYWRVSEIASEPVASSLEFGNYSWWSSQHSTNFSFSLLTNAE